jgi:hypothetical protein
MWRMNGSMAHRQLELEACLTGDLDVHFDVRTATDVNLVAKAIQMQTA